MLSSSQKQIILGGLLGDSSFNKEENRVRFSHSEKQKEYLKWKYNFFNKEAVTNIKSHINKWNNKEYLAYHFDFRNLKSNKSEDDDVFLKFIKKNLYSKSGRKKISMKYLDKLNPLGIAVWWLDDGSLCISKRNRYGILCTHCFNFEENLLIQKYFKDKWDINVSIKKEKDKYYFLRFNVTALKKLIKIIYPYVTQIPNMIYKIDLMYNNKGCIKEFEDIYYYIKSCKIY